MLKEQAIKISRASGAKITHRYFTDEEWMIVDGGKVTFEDGYSCSLLQFFEDRDDPSWNKDWEIVKEDRSYFQIPDQDDLELITNTHYYKWLEGNVGEDLNFRDTKLKYLKTLGFVLNRNKLTSEDSDRLRYIEQHYSFNFKKYV